ncbi:MAG: arsenite efflux transporter metallochaperone ArsD [Balneolaceae bacterium]
MMKQPDKTATLIEVFDPAMCCSTGVCGPDVDDSLTDFANDVKWLKSRGVDVRRYNLGQEPEAFKINPNVLARLKQAGTDVLPLIIVNGEIASESVYPDRKQLTIWAGLESADPSSQKGYINSQNEELLQQLEQAVTDGNEEELRTLFAKGEQLGLSTKELVRSIQAGINDRQTVTQQLVQKANELLGVPQNGCAPGSGCC